MKLIHVCPKCQIEHEMECTPEPNQLCTRCAREGDKMKKVLINPPPTTKRCQCCGKKTAIQKSYRQTDPLGGVSASWECLDCINLNYDSYVKRKNNSLDGTIWELCPHCETEVELKAEFKRQSCPNCGKKIKPCSLCDMNQVNCDECNI